ncbi:ATP-binding protein [Streptomyces sp. NBC_00588]|uniref:ATP-binding protein n=1 Tax=Streptomyces sp. NBC_00588 TaxID=2975784 RepID=UPI002E80B765|nr:ATP-binding protein [Streptomyces sp. NBC_00588]WUB38170.1 ATP-binding protein [Streptomyces sp. NBC_00588]
MTDCQEVAEKLLEELVSEAKRSETIADPRSALDAVLSKSRAAPITYQYDRKGPDHDTVFTALASDKLGRQGFGQGRSKKLAARNAALDFLRVNIPHALQDNPESSQPRPTLGEIHSNATHENAVHRLQEMFALPPIARPLLGQALVHPSWAYEQRRQLEPIHQQDNQALGFIGSQVLNFEYALTRARNAIHSPPDTAGSGSVPNVVYDSAFRQTGLAHALLLGVGQASQGIPVEAGSNAFQAVVGAVFVAKNFPLSLVGDWPLEWQPLWSSIMAPQAYFDPTTTLTKLASSMQLEVDYKIREYGPDHDKQRRANAVLSSSALKTSVSVREGKPVASKAAARQAGSEVALAILNTMAQRLPAQALSVELDRDASVARFILAHQAATLMRNAIPLSRWIAGQLFGLHWAATPEALLDWAVEADQILTRAMKFEEGIPNFEKVFRAAIDAEQADDQARGIAAELFKLLARIERIDRPESLTREDLERLVQLCDIYRCLGTSDPDITLECLVDDWTVLHRQRVDITCRADASQISVRGRERAVLDAIVAALLNAAGEIGVEVSGNQPLRLRFIAELDESQRQSVSQICTLWAGVTRTLTLTPNEQGLEATVVGAHVPTTRGPITLAALAALQPRSEPYLASVADLLHDLKNQVTAAGAAAQAPARSRTARLEQQLTASRHLDHAQALAIRLKASTSSLSYDNEQSTELGPFLRSYAANVLTRLPGTMSLSVPDARRIAHVAIGEGTLRAILDNLVSNAIEAMQDGGSITLEWTADSYEAIVEISDTGPGLPPDILNALESGERIRSTKARGNGLGLLGARTLLTRAGGELTALPASRGATWLLTLPIAPTLTETQ